MTDQKELIEQLRKPWTDVEHLQKLCAKAADALEDEQCAVVKPLEWRESDSGSEWYAYCFREEYEIFKHDGEYHFWAEGEGPSYGSLEEAKAAAQSAVQADFERDIIPSLAIRPAAEVAAEVIEAAARIVDPAANARQGLWAKNLRNKADKIRSLHTPATIAALKRKGGASGDMIDKDGRDE